MPEQNQIQPTILWHDYEAWGADPHRDHPSQFAAIRTDLDLNEVGKPVNWMCQIPNDYLPHPMACLITGITPQKSLRDGLIEAEFMAKVHQELAQPNTCVAGYNSIRFDDELTRFSLYRNFYDPYAREWQHGNSRWDIIDLVRATYALRPEGIEWVYRENGEPSFKLEQLSVANGILHEDAHDALSDVRATIGLAKLIRDKQPKLFQYYFSLRAKNSVWQHLDTAQLKPLVHVSSKLPSANGCCTWIVPISSHPVNKNAVICLNLALDPRPLLDNDVASLQEKLFVKNEDLAEGEQRLPIKLLHVNKCPFIAPAKSLTTENAERLDIDRDACLKNLQYIKQNRDQIEPTLVQLYTALEDREHESQDSDHALYSGGFINNKDRDICQQIVASEPSQLSKFAPQLRDPRLVTLLFRYRARNFPHTLDEPELQRWQSHRYSRLHDQSTDKNLNMHEFMLELERLGQEHGHNPNKMRILKDLYLYVEQL